MQCSSSPFCPLGKNTVSTFAQPPHSFPCLPKCRTYRRHPEAFRGVQDRTVQLTKAVCRDWNATPVDLAWINHSTPLCKKRNTKAAFKGRCLPPAKQSGISLVPGAVIAGETDERIRRQALSLNRPMISPTLQSISAIASPTSPNAVFPRNLSEARAGS